MPSPPAPRPRRLCPPAARPDLGPDLSGSPLRAHPAARRGHARSTNLNFTCDDGTRITSSEASVLARARLEAPHNLWPGDRACAPSRPEGALVFATAELRSTVLPTRLHGLHRRPSAPLPPPPPALNPALQTLPSRPCTRRHVLRRHAPHPAPRRRRPPQPCSATYAVLDEISGRQEIDWFLNLTYYTSADPPAGVGRALAPPTSPSGGLADPCFAACTSKARARRRFAATGCVKPDSSRLCGAGRCAHLFQRARSEPVLLRGTVLRQPSVFEFGWTGLSNRLHAAPQWVFSPLPGSTIPPNCKCAPCPETRRVSAIQLRKTKTAFRGSFHRPSPALVSAARSPDSRPLASRSCDANAYNCMWVSPQARRPTLRRRLRPPRPDDSRPIPPSPGRSDRRSL